MVIDVETYKRALDLPGEYSSNDLAELEQLPVLLQAGAVTATIVQVSDTHLSSTHGYFVANWARVLERVRKETPDLVINTGDVSLNGARSDADIQFAQSQHVRLPAPWHAVPGNHDVGEEPGAELLDQPTGPTEQERWTASFGTSHWAVSIDSWLLIGINCFLFGTGLPAEAEQWAWLERTVCHAGGPVGLFVHKPLFIDRPDEEPRPVYTVTPTARQALLDVVGRGPIRFVANGHLHQHRRTIVDGVSYVWAPSSAFPADTILQGADTELGWLRWQLDGDDFDVEVVHDEALERQDLQALRGGHSFLYQTPPWPPDPADLD